MSTQFQIISAAMLAIDGNAVQSYTDGSREAAVAEATYDTLKKTFLSSSNWNCVVGFWQLSREVAAPDNKLWSYQFLPPPEWLSYIDIVDANGRSLDYASEGGKILCNSDTVVAKYRKNLSEGDFPAWLELAFIYFLAVHWANPISGDENVLAVALGHADRTSKIAKLEDGRNNPPFVLIQGANSPWLAAHRGSR
ncbi:hypothetical protein [Dongia sp.]|uniref:hypothetical protein n=1 Tax=Dongia sp. TaxID=1977262 RepID=UPI0035B4189F